MSFTGNEDHSITLQAAAQLTGNYRTNNPNAILGLYYSKDAILEILNQQDCVGVRAYYAETSTGEKTLVFVGVNALGNDMVNGVIADFGVPCPVQCSSANDLNS